MGADALLDLALGPGVVLGLTLVVRLLTLPLLTAAQRGARRRAEAARGFPAAALGELVLGVAGSVGLILLVDTRAVYGFRSLEESIVIGHAWDLLIVTHVSPMVGRIVFLLIAIPLLVLGLVLWVLTQRSLLVSGQGGWGEVSPAVRARLVVVLLLRVVIGVFGPVCLVVAALVVQAVALVVSRRVPESGAVAPMPPVLGHAAPVPGLPVQPQPGYAPAYAPPAPAAPPAQHAPYVPTQADHGAGTGGVPAPRTAYQELHPGEPRTIGGYRLLGRIGAGGMGTVFLAQREGAATQVALKTLNPEWLDDAELLRRFEREARVLAMVPGAYTARVLDTGVDAGRPYLAMELLDGRPLDAHLRELGPIREPQALRALALALAVALSEVHRLGLVHRDLKPGNIMLTTAGPRLLDFGIAAIVDGTRLTRTGGGPGTLTYMAPEQLDDGAVGPAADIWAWACCVVSAAHGASPFAATSTGAVIRRIVDTGPEPLALGAVQALDPALAAVVGRALTADPAARPADGTALVELLTAGQGRPAPFAETVRDQITQGWRTLAL